jgi:hypothetical protein
MSVKTLIGPDLADAEPMSPHPVSLQVTRSLHRERIQVLIRMALLIALGAIARSSICWIAYFVLPALAAILIQQKGGEGYLAQDGPRIRRVLHWLAGAYAYLWLLTDALPSAEGGSVMLEIEPDGTPSAGAAVSRLIRSLPALVVGMVLSFAAAFVWIVAASCTLINEEVPASVADFLTATLRFQFRFFAYHLSLVERYPAFESSSASRPSSVAG